MFCPVSAFRRFWPYSVVNLTLDHTPLHKFSTPDIVQPVSAFRGWLPYSIIKLTLYIQVHRSWDVVTGVCFQELIILLWHKLNTRPLHNLSIPDLFVFRWWLLYSIVSLNWFFAVVNYNRPFYWFALTVRINSTVHGYEIRFYSDIKYTK